MTSIRVAIVGVGNCASSLVQGVHFYRDADPAGTVPGLMHVQFGDYHVSSLEFVAAFDVDAKKVGFDLAEAINASENNTIKIADVPPTGVTVQRGPTLDGAQKMGTTRVYPVPFTGDGPDIVGSVFGMYVQTRSTYESAPNEPEYDGMKKYKFGLEGTYSLLPWFAASMRYDRVTPNSDEPRQTFAVISPRLIFRTGWQAHDQIVLQYSHWFNGDRVIVRDGYPPHEDRRMPPGPNRVDPDEDMISLSASMWW